MKVGKKNQNRGRVNPQVSVSGSQAPKRLQRLKITVNGTKGKKTFPKGKGLIWGPGRGGRQREENKGARRKKEKTKFQSGQSEAAISGFPLQKERGVKGKPIP